MPILPVRIREYRPEDRERVFEIISKVLYGELSFPRDRKLDEDLDDISATFAPPLGVFMVIEFEGEIVGTGGLRPARDNLDMVELRRMYILPEHRKKGFGTAIGHSLLTFAKEAGYKQIMLETTDQMQSAEAIYRTLGFREPEENESAPIDPRCGLKLILPL
ncbi:MAG: GNAT family N-acetyltransferase [Planctomycetes bacterium]|nr:GNAT family N-acetyltransferase [Planctomycetota bacterium]